MFTYSELVELEDLCHTNPTFKKYFDRYTDENNHLLSKIAHEIGNPLTIIYSTVQLMEVKEPSITSFQYWNQLKEDIRGISLLLQNYADYNTCTRLNVREENLCSVLDFTVKSFEPILASTDISLCLEIAEDMIPLLSHFRCDGMKLQQVFLNILKNGVEALGNKGDTWIRVPSMGEKIQDLTQGENYLIVVIGNNGSPIPVEEIDDLFTPLISSKLGGSGIGLSISSKIVNAHDGIIFVNSVESQTEFAICLPL